MIYPNLIDLNTLVAERMVSKRKHPTLPLWVYNYTAKAQHTPIALWTPALCDARGLILDEAGEIVGRPFSKFWNTEQVADKIDWDEPFIAYEKVDGSLGIICQFQGQLVVSTRKSFESDQAKWAYDYIKQRTPQWVPPLNCTYLAEIVYPENRIVVDYRGKQELVLLTIMRNSDGYDFPWITPRDTELFRPVRTYHNWAGAKDVEPDNEEGRVLRWNNGFRAKVKFAEYVRLHRLMYHCSTRTIWEMLRKGESLYELFASVPVDFREWADAQVSKLRREFYFVKGNAEDLFYARVREGRTESRKEFAEWAKAQTHPALLFHLLDGKGIAKLVWEIVRPAFGTPFRSEIE